MGFVEAVQSGFQRYVDFETRSSRSEYWFWVLLMLIGQFVGSLLGNILGMIGSLVFLIWALGTIIPSIAVGIRRLHDIGKSGWFILVAFIPIVGWIIMIVWAVSAGEDEDNQWGANPLGGGEA